MAVPAVHGRDPMKILSGEKLDQNRTKRSTVCLDARGVSWVSLLLTTLNSPLVLEKASSGIVREFCEFSGVLGFSSAGFLTVCVRRCFFGFFHTFQLVIGKHLCFFNFALQSHCYSAWACTAFGGAWLYSARGVCDTRLPVATSVGHLYSNDWWRHGNSLVISPHYGLHWFVLCMFSLFLFYYFALFETRLQEDFCF